MVHCVAFGCNHSSSKKHRKDGSSKKHRKDVHFFNFPRDKSLRQVWIKLLRREGYQWKDGHKLCSDHFDMSQFEVHPIRMAEFGYPNAQARLKTDAVPKFNYSTTEPHTQEQTGKQKTGRVTPNNSKRRIRKRLKILPEIVYEDSDAEAPGESASTDTASENEDDLGAATQSNSYNVKVQASPHTMTIHVQVEPDTQTKGTSIMVETSNMGCQTSVAKVDMATQTEVKIQGAVGQSLYNQQLKEHMDYHGLGNEELYPTHLPQEDGEVIDLSLKKLT